MAFISAVTVTFLSHTQTYSSPSIFPPRSYTPPILPAHLLSPFNSRFTPSSSALLRLSHSHAFRSFHTQCFKIVSHTVQSLSSNNAGAPQNFRNVRERVASVVEKIRDGTRYALQTVKTVLTLIAIAVAMMVIQPNTATATSPQMKHQQQLQQSTVLLTTQSSHDGQMGHHHHHHHHHHRSSILVADTEDPKKDDPGEALLSSVLATALFGSLAFLAYKHNRKLDKEEAERIKAEVERLKTLQKEFEEDDETEDVDDDDLMESFRKRMGETGLAQDAESEDDDDDYETDDGEDYETEDDDDDDQDRGTSKAKNTDPKTPPSSPDAESDRDKLKRMWNASTEDKKK